MRTTITDRYEAIDQQLLTDVGFVNLLVAFVTAIHFGLPASIRAKLLFNHDAFEPWTLLTSAYVHHDATHLLNNLVGLLIAASAIYWLCWQLEARRWFRVTAATFVLALPILVNLSSYAIFEVIVPNASPTTRGFSGVVAGFAGFLFAALVVWIAAQTTWSIAVYLGEGVTVLMAWILALIYSGFELHIAGLAVVGIGFSGWGVLTETNPARIRNHWRESLPDASVAFGVIMVLLWFLLVLFPLDFTSGEVATNIFAHGAGFVWGTLLALVLWKGWSFSD
ncbi:hypothetical protein [Salinibaculum rarum]|uniref:hypothetical protein n=1 Tax=Salinibaculum rarum TaxID=3058903 RepID=UPI00265DE5A2|nr:hypothetical protein [Salinibaculum sp. KK48]